MLAIHLIGKLGDLIRKLKDYYDKNKQINQLYSLSDAELRDLGLTRYQISSIK